jgi:hypothetical protein
LHVKRNIAVDVAEPIMKKTNKTMDVEPIYNKRRQFVFQAAAGTVVATLASKTAWAGGSNGTGCSVSGNLSGNLSQARDCSSDLVQGKSPGQWKRVLDRKPHKNEVWKNVFGIGIYPDGSGDAEASLLDFLPEGSLYVGNGINEALVTAYLNAKYGHYPLATGVDANTYVIGLHESIASGVFTQSDIIDAVKDTYNAD